MRKLVIVAALAAIAGGGLYYGLMVYPDQRFHAALDQAIQKLPAGYAASYKTAHYAPLSHLATVTGLSIRTAGPQASATEIAEVAIQNPTLDFQEKWDLAAANPTALQPDQALPIADKISVTGLTFHAPMVSAALATASLDKPRLYPWALLHPGVPSLTEALSALSIDPAAPPDLSRLAPPLRLEAAIMLGIGYDGYIADNLGGSAKLPPNPAAPGAPIGDITFSFRKIQVSSFDRGVGGDSSGEGLVEQVGPAMKVSLDRIAISRMDFRKPMTQLLNGDPLGPALLDGFKIGRIEYDGLSAQTGAGAPVAVNSFFISNIAFSQGFPVSGEFGLSGLRLSKAQMPDARGQQAFERLGLDTMTLSVGGVFALDIPQKTASARDVSLKIDELGALRMSADLTGVDPADPEETGKASLARATLRYDDASLIDRLLRATSPTPADDPAKARQAFAAQVSMVGASFENSPEIAVLAKAVTAFATAPHSLTVTLAPPTPVPVMMLSNIGALEPPKIVKLLGLSAVANQ